MPSLTKSMSSEKVATTPVVSFDYLETFKICLDDAASFLRLAGTEPKPVLSAVLEKFEEKVGSFPLSCPISSQLLELGVSKYRECLVGNYRIFFSYSEKSYCVTVYALVSQRQDIQKILYRRLVLI